MALTLVAIVAFTASEAFSRGWGRGNSRSYGNCGGPVYGMGYFNNNDQGRWNRKNSNYNWNNNHMQYNDYSDYDGQKKQLKGKKLGNL